LKDVGGHVAFLTPLSSADWCKDHVYGKALILALNGRLCFIPNWAKTIDPSTLKKGKGPARCYAAPPLYPKDCMLSLFSPEITPGFEVWNWRQP
jgi:hypothetical protein